MADKGHNDPLSIRGFVIDYIVWRLGKAHCKWRDAPAVRMGAEVEHQAMRLMCLSNEESRAKYMRWGFDEFLKHKVREQLAEDSRVRGRPESVYLDVIDFISFTGLECLEKATLEQFDEIGEIAQTTIKYLEEGLRQSWKAQGCSWAGFMTSTAAHRQYYSKIVEKRDREDEQFNYELTFVAQFCALGAVTLYVTYKIFWSLM